MTITFTRYNNSKLLYLFMYKYLKKKWDTLENDVNDIITIGDGLHHKASRFFEMLCFSTYIYYTTLLVIFWNFKILANGPDRIARACKKLLSCYVWSIERSFKYHACDNGDSFSIKNNALVIRSASKIKYILHMIT